VSKTWFLRGGFVVDGVHILVLRTTLAGIEKHAIFSGFIF
jgi:hypothetical protein